MWVQPQARAGGWGGSGSVCRRPGDRETATSTEGVLPVNRKQQRPRPKKCGSSDFSDVLSHQKRGWCVAAEAAPTAAACSCEEVRAPWGP